MYHSGCTAVTLTNDYNHVVMGGCTLSAGRLSGNPWSRNATVWTVSRRLVSFLSWRAWQTPSDNIWGSYVFYTTHSSWQMWFITLKIRRTLNILIRLGMENRVQWLQARHSIQAAYRRLRWCHFPANTWTYAADHALSQCECTTRSPLPSQRQHIRVIPG